MPEAITDDVFIYRILQKEDDVNREINEFYSKDANSFSPRYILASTLMNATVNAEEKASLKKYQDAIASIEDKETRLAITKNAIRTAIFEREAGITGSQYNITKLKESARLNNPPKMVHRSTDGKKVAVIDSNILEGVPKSKWNQTVINELSKIKFIPVRNDIIGVNSRTKGEMLKSEYTKWLKNNAKSKYYSKLQTAPYLNDVVEASTDYVNEGLKHSRKDNFVGFARGNVLLQIGTKKYSADVVVGITSNQKMIFYDIVNMYDTNFEIKKKSQLYDTITKSEDRRRVATSSKFKVAENEDFVNKKNSLKDSDGTMLTDAQIDYFKDSQIKDSNGNLKVMYHGSGESFTVFDKKKAKSSGYYGSGFYFTESESHAKQYGSNYKVYLNITNPMQQGTNDITKAQLKKFVEAVG